MLLAASDDVYRGFPRRTKELVPGENPFGFTYTLTSGFRWVSSRGSFPLSHTRAHVAARESGKFVTARRTAIHFRELGRGLFLQIDEAETRTKCRWLVFDCKTLLVPSPSFLETVPAGAIGSFSLASYLQRSYDQFRQHADLCTDTPVVIPTRVRLPYRAYVGRILFMVSYAMGPVAANAHVHNISSLFTIALDDNYCDSIYKLQLL